MSITLAVGELPTAQILWTLHLNGFPRQNDLRPVFGMTRVCEGLDVLRQLWHQGERDCELLRAMWQSSE